MKPLTKGLKVVLLGLTLWPILYTILFLMFVMTMTHGIESIFLVHGLTMLLILGLMVFYMVHLFKAPAIDGTKKILWAIALVWGGIVAMPIYFFNYIWPEESR